MMGFTRDEGWGNFINRSFSAGVSLTPFEHVGNGPVVIAVVLQALWGLTRSALKTKSLVVTGLIAVTLNVLGVHWCT